MTQSSRTLDLAHPQEKVWGALTTIEGLTGWFGTHADGQIAPRHDVKMRWEQYGNAEQTLAIQVIDPMSVFAYCSAARADAARATSGR